VFASVNCKVPRLEAALCYLYLRLECISAINRNILSKARQIRVVTLTLDNTLQEDGTDQGWPNP
jgi:hypothetical protein